MAVIVYIKPDVEASTVAAPEIAPVEGTVITVIVKSDVEGVHGELEIVQRNT